MGTGRRTWLLMALGACVLIALGTMTYAFSLAEWGNLMIVFYGIVDTCIAIGLVALGMLGMDLVRARRRGRMQPQDGRGAPDALPGWTRHDRSCVAGQTSR